MRFIIAAALASSSLSACASAAALGQGDVMVMTPDEERRALIGCVDDSGMRAQDACQGLISRPCLNSEDGMTTVGMMGCMGRELEVWDELLNQAYADEMNRWSEDGEWGERQQARLRDAQRIWITLRDADCDYAAGFNEGGSIARIVRVSCLLDATAARTIQLRYSTGEN
jgi:uncharacterized protein YecT (DUF1311 family)